MPALGGPTSLMPYPPDSLPAELAPLADAIDVSTIRVTEDGYRAVDLAGAPFVHATGLPPYDGRYWSSFTSTGICVGLDLTSHRVPSTVRDALAGAAMGGWVYEYEVDQSRSQRTNRDNAFARLAERIRKPTSG